MLYVFSFSFFVLFYFLFFFWCIGSGSTSKVIDWNRREMITVFSFSWLTETECLKIEFCANALKS